MSDIRWAERLLSLVTSPDNAAAITGDLSEERSQRGAAWFWRQVLGTIFCLCRGALAESPVIVLSFFFLGFLLLVGFGAGGVAAAKYVFPMLNLSQDRPLVEAIISVSLLLSTGALVWWSGALLAGAALVAAAPKQGMVACTLLVSTVETLLFGIGLFWHMSGGVFSIWSVVWIICLTTPVFLLLGGAMIRRRWHLRTAE